MKLILLLFIIFAPMTALSGNDNSSEDLFMVLTSGDAETQMMAMVLATQSANQDVAVRVLLCSEAGELAIRGVESPEFAPANRSPKQLLNGLIDRGVNVEVCGIFLPNREYTEEDLTDGIGVAAPPEVAEYMRREGVRYFTF
ncbi:DsrE family protein [Rhodohalobacter sp. SW132]|uniref:DsrE family protein n=2 Tax=Rhodohalobacter sp. SW132 TaxID=2293433 RepID=UPI001AE0DFCB|nr:DsrE family protein [Rhodohalobacter sp. SW132]